ncbi:hypothetical protein GGQ94_001325 [Petrimonas sulfuriphila]
MYMTTNLRKRLISDKQFRENLSNLFYLSLKNHYFCNLKFDNIIF